MRSATLLRASALMLLLTSSACASRPVVIHSAQEGCSTLLADDWLSGVRSAPLPAQRPALASGAPVQAQLDQAIEERTDWQLFGVAQTDRLEIANSRLDAAVGVVKRCEARDAAAVKRIQAPWWQRPFLPPPDS